MKIIEGRRDTTSSASKRRKLKVDILGRGRESITVNSDNTVSDLRQSLGIGNNVRAVDASGKTMRDSDRIKNKEEINFVPNVKGGSGLK